MPVVLVTGGAGFIGHHLVRHLVEEGRTVRVLDDFSTGKRERLAPLAGRIELVEGSAADPAAAAQACDGVGIVFHQAAIPSVSRSVADPVATHRANATGTLVLLEAARGAGVGRFVYAGSSSAYGNTPELPKREDQFPRPLSPYAVSKLAGEQYCRAYAHVHGMEAVALRYFNVFGPGQDPTSQYSAAIPLFITRALAGAAPTIHGDGGQTRDFTYVENVVRANRLAAEAPAERVTGRVFNVGCGERLSIGTLWEKIRALVAATDPAGPGAGPPIPDATYAPARPGDVRDSLADVSAIREAIGYVPEIGLDEGLRRTVDWYRRNTAGAAPVPRP